jgi:hypothetical protein
MIWRPSPSMALGILLGFLVAAAMSPALAVIVFDDHFDGNSGGVPEGWQGDGAIIEQGTVVTLYDNAGMATLSTFDPNAGTATIWVDIAGASYRAMVGIMDATGWSRLFVKIRATDGQIQVKAGNTEQEEDEYIAGYATGYEGGPIRLTVVLDLSTFSVSTDDPPFSSGPIEYSAVFSSFTRADLGPAARLLTDIQLEGQPSAFASYDRITMDVTSAAPVERSSFGRIKTRHRR